MKRLERNVNTINPMKAAYKYRPFKYIYYVALDMYTDL